MYNCGYGLDDSIDDVLAMIKDITLKKVVLNKKGKTIPIEKKKIELQLKVSRVHRKRNANIHSCLKCFIYRRQSHKYVIMRRSTSMLRERCATGIICKETRQPLQCMCFCLRRNSSWTSFD